METSFGRYEYIYIHIQTHTQTYENKNVALIAFAREKRIHEHMCASQHICKLQKVARRKMKFRRLSYRSYPLARPNNSREKFHLSLSLSRHRSRIVFFCTRLIAVARSSLFVGFLFRCAQFPQHADSSIFILVSLRFVRAGSNAEHSTEN